VSALFAFCGKVENTMHLLYECAWCFEPLWKLVGEAITALIRQDSPTAQTYRIDVHSAIYNIYDGQIMAACWSGYGMVSSNQQGLNLLQI
jgi:hypothetical protein